MGGLSSCRIWKRACRMRKRQQQLPITDVRNGDKFSCTTFLMGGKSKGMHIVNTTFYLIH